MRFNLFCACLLPALPLLAAEPAAPVVEIEPQMSPLDLRIELLAAKSWEAREAVQNTLIENGSQDFDRVSSALLAILATHRDPEVRFRIRQILKELVDRQVFIEHKGFLGVQLQQRPANKTVDGRTVTPILISQVLPGHAAIRNGVRMGEEIVSVDGKYCDKKEFTLPKFIAYIQSRGPGTLVQLRLLAADGSLRTLEIPLGRRMVDGDPPIAEQKKLFFKDWLKTRLAERESS